MTVMLILAVIVTLFTIPSLFPEKKSEAPKAPTPVPVQPAPTKPKPVPKEPTLRPYKPLPTPVRVPKPQFVKAIIEQPTMDISDLVNYYNIPIDYHAYLQTGKWRRKAKARFILDSYSCQTCGSGTELNCHHLHYRTLGEEDPYEDLATLCKECHETLHLHHGKDAGDYPVLSKRPRLNSSDISSILAKLI